MQITEIRDALMPALFAHCGVPIIEQDQTGVRPDGPHGTYKFTSPYIKDVGLPNETAIAEGNTYFLSQSETYKVTLSLSAYAMDGDESYGLAVKMREWFDFYGADELEGIDVVVVTLGNIENRDAFVVDDYERRNGFDVTLRVFKELKREVGYIEKIEVNDVIY